MRIAIIVFLAVCFSQTTTVDTLAQTPFYSSGRQAQNCEPYRVGRATPKLTTPQWVGEPGVDAVVILSIDDMRDAAKYESFLRPLLDRLKKINGRAPVSIFTNEIDPGEPQLQKWLSEGLSLEVHTVDHPCPLLSDGDFSKAKSTYDRCVDLMNDVPNSNAVAFRMPCCDSLNTPSPRFWKEIFERKSAGKNYLSIDSSVFNIFTSDDPQLPSKLTTREDGNPRFRHYLPFKSFVNTIENYPYPYIVGESCWEFPCVVPSDWEAQNVQRPNNPETVRDLQRALDATVVKQGVMPIVFHPHGWIRNDQLVEFVDYAVKTYGKRVKFLNFAESLERINENLLGGVPLRTDDGNEHGVLLVDVNADGFVDVVRNAKEDSRSVVTRVWNVKTQSYDAEKSEIDFSRPSVFYRNRELHLLTHEASGLAAYKRRNDQLGNNELVNNKRVSKGWLKASLKFSHEAIESNRLSESDDVQWHDIDHDGTDEMFLTHGGKTDVLRWSGTEFAKTPFDFPTPLVAKDGGDAGVRLVDLNGDKKLDLLESNGTSFTVWDFVDSNVGWEKVRAGTPTSADAIPVISRQDGTNNGAWFHSDHLWVQNEFTDRKPDLVERIPFRELVSTKQATSGADTEHPLGQAKTLEESVASFSIPTGAKLEVVAAEPEIQDPIAFDWGPNGELWVVEMGDYPNGANWHGPGDKKGDPGGRVKRLEDKDGDGRYETSHVFMDKLSSPTGVKSWRKGVLICAPPNIIYAEDTDGDHKADKREVLFTGMHEGNQQHRANGLRWGLDHWLYLGNGDSGGVVRSTKTGKEVDTSGRDFRIKPDDGLIELVSGPTQFGRNRDEEGNWFGGDNSNPVWHYVLDERYMRRNPHFSPPSSRHQTADVPGAAPVFPTSETVERFNDFDRANRFTSACSPEIYRMNSVYICEPVHNLVHRSTLRRDGVTFASSRRDDEQQSEFLTSSDNWFRPVMVRTGPDQAIWVADMYRMVIEHPEWIPMQWQKQIDHLSGNDKGRIYRITLPKSESGTFTKPKDAWAKIREADLGPLVELLRSDSRVTRDMVQQEILRRNDPACVADLKNLRKLDLAAQSTIDYLLHHFDAFDFDRFARTDGQGLPSVHALRLIEPKLNESKSLREMLFKLAEDKALVKDPSLRMQCAYSLGECSDPLAGKALGRIALDSLGQEHDRYIHAAVMSSISGENVEAAMTTFLASEFSEDSRSAANEFLEDLVRSAVGFENKAAVKVFVAKTTATPYALDRFTGPISSLLRSVRRRNKSLQTFVGAEATTSVRQLAKRANSIVGDEDKTESDRLSAMALFGFFPELRAAEEETLIGLLSPREPTQLQRRAIEMLSEVSPGAHRFVFRRWNSFTPALRDTTLNVAVRNFGWTLVLLDAIREGDVLPVQVSVRHRQQLLNHRLKEIRKVANELFQKADSNREAVVQKYAVYPSSAPNLAKGKVVFAKQCSACHQLEGEGNAIGPDLTAISDKSMAAMLVAVLDPNRAVEDKYLGYTAVTSDGETHQGILLDESATAIMLATPDGKQVSVLRNQLEELKGTGESFMPEGLEQVLAPQDVADVVAYVKSISVPRKHFAGNEPQLAPVRDDGSIRLFAIHAEIYGPKIVFEEKYHNLGFWSDDTDRAVWSIDAPAAGKYELHLDYACSPQPTKNRYQIRVNGQVIGGDVESTNSWDTYRSKKVGTLELPDEPVQLTIQSEGPINGFLMDLRTILLYPEE